MADESGSWNVDMEVNLFHAMRGHKPVGVNRHFHMVFIHDKLSNAASKKLTAKSIWNHLSTMYDLQALNESEILPFPNKPMDFQLPYAEHRDFGDEEFPRMQNLQGTLSVEDVKGKPEGQAKGGKATRSDTKASQSSKSDSRSGSMPSETKSSHTSKSDCKGGSTPSGQGKGGGKSSHGSSGHAASFTPDPSPKRGKRTRGNQSTNSSPATLSETPTSSKRRR